LDLNLQNINPFISGGHTQVSTKLSSN